MLCVSSERSDKGPGDPRGARKEAGCRSREAAEAAEQGQGWGTKPAEIEQSIGRLKQRYSRVARYYRMDYDREAGTFRYSVDEEKRARAEKLDGSYLLKTGRENLTADEAWRIYILLKQAESLFGR